MLELHTTFDLLGSITQFVNSCHQNIQAPEPFNPIPRIISQEKGGLILFVWTDVDKDKPSSIVTHFGLYEPQLQKHSLVYTYGKKVKVKSCSINQERTLLAFSIVKPREPGMDKKVKEVHQAYLAQLQSSEKIVFSLNMERSTFLKLQFLYPDTQISHGRDSHMLVFIHKESIGLYKVPMARIGDRGVMMSAQPKTEQIVRKFVWCQWDVQNQHLHYIHNVRIDSSTEHISQRLSSVQFSANGKYENMIDVRINFPFPYIRTVDTPHYGDIPLHQGIPELALNVTVLTQPSGPFCICYQKIMSDSKTNSSPQPTSDFLDVEYYISLVHHAKTLYGCAYSLPRQAVMQKRLVFTWIGSYLAVMLPGYFVHLLNISPKFEPCHHILLHNYQRSHELGLDGCSTDVSANKSGTAEDQAETPQTPQTPSTQPAANQDTPSGISAFSDECSAMKTLLLCQSFMRERGALAQNLYDYRRGCLMKLVVNTDALIEHFQHAYWQTRLAILHYLIIHSKDMLAIQKLFFALCENVTNPEINAMMTEYLVASTFAEMRKQVDKDVLSLLSFTSTETLRGQFEKSPSGDRLAHISYISMEVIDINKWHGKNIRTRTNEDFWDSLNQGIRRRYTDPNPRFTYDSVMKLYRQSQLEQAESKGPSHAVLEENSFFDGISTFKMTELPPMDKAGRRSRVDSILGLAPLFLQTKIVPESKVFKHQLSVQTEDLLTSHLIRHLKMDSRSKAKNVSKEFLFCQNKVSRQLCHLIWSLRGHHLTEQMEDGLLPNLYEPGSDEDYELFQLYERFYLVAGELCFPLPSGFSSIFTSLGFKCMDLHPFLQYVDNHILALTPDFILQLLQDLQDDLHDEVAAVKFQIISRLPKPFAQECFERWNHPITQQARAQEQVAQILLNGTPNQRKSSTPRAPVVSDSDKFQPLITFMKHLDHLVENLPFNRVTGYDHSLIEDTALYYTKSKSNFDMSSVNF